VKSQEAEEKIFGRKKLPLPDRFNPPKVVAVSALCADFDPEARRYRQIELTWHDFCTSH